jgi:hypothetical protein
MHFCAAIYKLIWIAFIGIKVTLLYRSVSGYSDLTVLSGGDLACLYEACKAHWEEEILYLRILKETYLPSK